MSEVGKYSPLTRYLAELEPELVSKTMTFQEVADIVGGLPATAYRLRQWWANDSKVEARAWRAAGWHVDHGGVDFNAQTVRFRRGRVGGTCARRMGLEPSVQNAELRRAVPETPGHVFISYVREDSMTIDRLEATLLDAGIPVWRDVRSIGLGLDWRQAIHQAITKDALVVLACFSHASQSRDRTEQRSELILAAEEFRRRPADRAWLIPTRLSDCALPHVDLGAGRSLDTLQRLDLFDESWDAGCTRLISEVRRLLGPAKVSGPSHEPPRPSGAEPTSMRFTTHTATFRGSPVARYFLNVTNLSDRTVSITHTWFEHGSTHVPVAPLSRPLPASLAAGQTWSTWIEAEALPESIRHDAHGSFRLRLASGEEWVDVRDDAVPPVGSVPGGPVADEDVRLTGLSSLQGPSVTGTGSAAAAPPVAEYRTFWDQYLRLAPTLHPDWAIGTTPPRQNYMYQQCSLNGCRIAPAFKRDGRLGHELVIMSPDPTHNLETFRRLRSGREAFEQAYGRALTWDERPGAKRCLIGDYRTGSIDSLGEYDNYVAWLIDCGARLRRALRHFS